MPTPKSVFRSLCPQHFHEQALHITPVSQNMHHRLQGTDRRNDGNTEVKHFKGSCSSRMQHADSISGTHIPHTIVHHRNTTTTNIFKDHSDTEDVLVWPKPPSSPNAPISFQALNQPAMTNQTQYPNACTAYDYVNAKQQDLKCKWREIEMSEGEERKEAANKA